MKYEVFVTRKAEDQLNDAAKWWAENRSVQQAEKWHGGLIHAIESLSENPDRFPLAREDKSFSIPIREMLYGVARKKTHRVLFTVRPDRVVIYGIRHVAQRDLTADDI